MRSQLAHASAWDVLIAVLIVAALPVTAWLAKQTVLLVRNVAALRREAKWDGDLPARIYAQLITNLAARIAGRKRLSLREEWRAHLAGNEGRGLPPREKLRAASGFAVAAVRYRLRDASLVAWKLIDAVLKSRPLSNMFVLIPTTVAAVVILHHDGTVGLLGSAESIAAIGGTLYGLVRVGRWWRDVKPPEPKARRAKE